MILESILQYVCEDTFVYQLLASLTSYIAINLLVFFRTRKKRYQLFKHYGISGPEPRLLDGNLGLYLDRKACHKIDQQFKDKYGKVFGIHLGDRPHMIVSDLDVLKSVFIDNVSHFKERALFIVDTPLLHSIFFADHNKWKFIRRVMSPAFSSYTVRGEKSSQFIEDSNRLMLNYIEDKVDPETKRANLNMQNLMQACSLYMVSSIAVDLPGVEVKEDEPHVESLNKFLSSIDGSLALQALKFPILRHLLTFLAKHLEHNTTMGRIHRVLDKRIERNSTNRPAARDGDKCEQIMDVLIKLYQQGRLSKAEVRGNAEALLVAGYHTTSSTLAYIFWVLGKHLDVQERLRAELMAHGSESKYLTQVINEVMRLYPVVMSFTTRRATETLVLHSLTIPQGTTVVFNSWLVQRDPDYWPEPSKFDPDRFREGAAIHPCAFAPFGIGERICIGQSLAMLEMKMIACDILLRYRIKTKAPEELELATFSDTMTRSSQEIAIELERLQ